jgi:hypothetical protein
LAVPSTTYAVLSSFATRANASNIAFTSVAVTCSISVSRPFQLSGFAHEAPSERPEPRGSITTSANPARARPAARLS